MNAPVTISPEARTALAERVRRWSGWPTANVVFGPTTVSPYAETHHQTCTITANPEPLVLNPNRVVLTLTPFRLRQEAVLTGALLHEAAHARHSHWQPGRYGNPTTLKHYDGTGKDVTKQALALAQLMEEARIEGLMTGEAAKVDASGLTWTMRAAAAYLLPMTDLSSDPEQALMDLLTSWALRAGRQYAHQLHASDYTLPSWVQPFTTMLHATITEHLTATMQPQPETRANRVIRSLIMMAEGNGGASTDTGTFMVDEAQRVLDILFPETDGDSDDAPMPGGGCEGDESEAPAQPEEDPEADEDADESDDQDSDEGQDPGEGDDAQGGDEDSTNPPPSAAQQAMAEALEKMETQADAETSEGAAKEGEAEAKAQAKGVTSTGEQSKSDWRVATPDEREVQAGAQKFLRDLVTPSTTSTVRLTESPSATVDGAALAAWRAGGQDRDPRFFRRVTRTMRPAPPVKVAVLVDVSGSMEVLQKPSALLSWALASSALDLRNFAGRGAQVESCLIHWGDHARVVQAPGQQLPGIREVLCREGTSAMPKAFAMIEENMPGFFDQPERPEHRLIVQFTDWVLDYDRPMYPWMQRTLEAGVNMLSVVPTSYSVRSSHLPDIIKACAGTEKRGGSFLMKYNPNHPGQVWSEAASILG